MSLGGYGRGWSEPLAKGRWNRFRQLMREPATKRDWNILLVLVVLLVSVGIVMGSI